MDNQVHCAIQNGCVCQMNDKIAACRNGPMQPVLPSTACRKLGLDIVGPHVSHDNMKSLLMTTTVNGQTLHLLSPAPLTLSRSFSPLFLVEGFPDEIITERGPQFDSYQFSTFFVAKRRH